MYKQKPVSLIMARSINGVIGIGNKLPWSCPKDMAIFKAMTTGCCVIMGRKTWESLPIKPLPNRKCIVITSQNDYDVNEQGCTAVHSLEEALNIATVPIMVIGGGSIYEQALKYADTIYVSLINIAIDVTGDISEYVFAPKIPSDFGQETQTHYSAEGDAPAFHFMTYTRRNESGPQQLWIKKPGEITI